MFSHQGYFGGFISKGVMSDENGCACTCRGSENCTAFNFHEISNDCYVYEDVSNLNEKYDEAFNNAYIKKSSGNNYLSVLTCRNLGIA